MLLKPGKVSLQQPFLTVGKKLGLSLYQMGNYPMKK